MADTSNVSFIMYSARDAVGAGLAHVEQQVRSIEHAVNDNPGLAFDLAKTLVESTCRTILGERNITYAETDDLPRLFKLAATYLPLLPAAASGESQARASLSKTLSGLNTAIQGLCELRNQYGFASHGAGHARPTMESAQARLAAQAADTIVGFLYSVHREDRTPPPSPRALYDENPIFNDYVDDLYGMIRIFEVSLRPSDVLFQVEPESYRVYLGDFDPEAEQAEREAPADDESTEVAT
jgi:hypothetical protein